MMAKTFKQKAMLMVQQGVPVFPLPPNEKAARLPNWQSRATTDEAQIDAWDNENSDYNCAAVAKVDKDNGIVILDCDAAGIKERIEAETGKTFQTFTVQSSGDKRHYYFRHTDQSRAAGNFDVNAEGKELFSVRAHNKYVVSAGSMHPTTKLPYKLIDRSEIIPMPRWLLQWLLAQKSNGNGHAPSLKLTEKVETGGRNTLLFKLGCSLRSKGVVEKAIAAALHAANDEQCSPPLTHDEVDVIVGSVMKYEAGTSVPGVVTFGEAQAAVGEAAEQTTEAEFTDEIEDIEEPLPEFPTITGSIHELATALDPDLPYQFKVMAAMVRIGLALSGRVQIANEPNLQTRLYVAFVAEKWRGKTAANEQVGDLLNTMLGSATESSVDSGPALVKSLNELKKLDEAPHLLIDPDELKDLFEKAKESKTARNSLFGEMLKLYENGRTANLTKKDGRMAVSDAHLAIIGGATPAGCERMWAKTGGGSDGLQSRFTVIGTNAGSLPIQRRVTDVAALTQAMERIQQQVKAPPPVVTIVSEAYRLLSDWWESIKDREQASRLPDIVKKFVVVLAVTSDTSVVDERIMSTGIAFGNHVLAARERYNPADSASNVQALEQRVEKCYNRFGDMTNRQVAKRLHPERFPGGFGAFNSAMRNLVEAERVEFKYKVAGSKRGVWGLS